MGCGIVIKKSSDLKAEFARLEANVDEYTKLSSKSHKYIEDRKGATEILMNFLRMNYPA